MSGTEGVELLEAVRQFLRQEVLPELDGFKAYNTRVAANALGIVAKEMQLGAGLAELDAQIATALRPVARGVRKEGWRSCRSRWSPYH